MRAHKCPIVGERETKVEHQWAPDSYVIEDGPIAGVEGDLGGNNDHQDCCNHGAKQVVVR